jgi:hypothetical protein
MIFGFLNAHLELVLRDADLANRWRIVFSSSRR